MGLFLEYFASKQWVSVAVKIALGTLAGNSYTSLMRDKEIPKSKIVVTQNWISDCKDTDGHSTAVMKPCVNITYQSDVRVIVVSITPQ
jgi:predicted signal transduction protein with EAL and GGDEF domain